MWHLKHNPQAILSMTIAPDAVSGVAGRPAAPGEGLAAALLRDAREMVQHSRLFSGLRALAVPPPRPRATAAAHRGKILVVDRDTATARIVADEFGPDGYTVDEQADPMALYTCDMSGYSLILVDLPESADGDLSLSLVEQVKQQVFGRRIAVVVCSSNLTPQRILQALSAGADDYLIKPFALREMAARCRTLLRRANQAR